METNISARRSLMVTLPRRSIFFQREFSHVSEAVERYRVSCRYRVRQQAA